MLKTLEIILSGISGVGGFLVAILAFQLSRRDKKIQLKSCFSLGIISTNKMNIPVYHIYIANIGIRVANVTGIKWVYRRFIFKKKKYVKEFEWAFGEFKNLSTQFPTQLKDGEEANIYYALDIFESMKIDDKENEFLLATSKITTFYRVFTFNVYISTTAQSDIKIPITYTIRRALWKQLMKKVKKNHVKDIIDQ